MRPDFMERSNLRGIAIQCLEHQNVTEGENYTDWDDLDTIAQDRAIHLIRTIALALIENIKPQWREPIPDDNGKTMLVHHQRLFDADYEREAYCFGLIQEDSEDTYTAKCAVWCRNGQDHWHTVELEMPKHEFLVCDVPTLEGLFDVKALEAYETANGERKEC